MILFSIGLPSAFAEWCDAVIFQAGSRALGTMAFAAAESLEELGGALLNSSSGNVIVKSRHPDGKLRKAIIDNAARVLLFLQNPFASVEDLVIKSGYTLPDAVRAVATSLAATHSFANATQDALILKMQNGEFAAFNCAKAICDHLGFSFQSDEIAEIVRSAASYCPTLIEHHSSWLESLDEKQHQVINGALAAYSTPVVGKDLEPLIWERELFFVGDAPAQIADHAVDITGRVRCLLYGPYIMVPSGRWTVNITIACSKESVGMSFMIEILAGREQLGSTRLQPVDAGVFEVTTSFVMEEKSTASIEMRIFNERAAFDGRLGLGRVTLVRSPSVSIEERKEISDALGLNI